MNFTKLCNDKNMNNGSNILFRVGTESYLPCSFVIATSGCTGMDRMAADDNEICD